MNPRFSICIPNYNYGSFISETIESILNQSFKNFEICIADNASTDNSWDVIQDYVSRYPNIKAIRNTINVGYAGNLDIVASLATGEWHIMLSSDDLMYSEALSLYDQIIQEHNNNPNILINSGFEKFDSDQPHLKTPFGLLTKVWKSAQKIPSAIQHDTYKASSNVLLHYGILSFLSPYNFACLCYSKEVYQRAYGYSSSRLMNPDKWFHWKICAQSSYSLFIDKPLFGYRWHNQNQTALQNQSGILKYWIDEYRNCFELSTDMLAFANLSRTQSEKSFMRNIIIGYALGSLAYGFPLKALRITAFGIYAYPKYFFSDYRTLALLFAMLAYPITWMLSKILSKSNVFNK